MIETKIVTVLTADTSILAVASNRLYPDVMPQNPTMPAITYERESCQRINSLGGYGGLENPHIIICSWATRKDDAGDLADKVFDAMNKANTFHALMINDFGGYDVDAGLYVFSQTYSCWNLT